MNIAICDDEKVFLKQLHMKINSLKIHDCQISDIKDSSNDACKGTINIVKGIAYKYKKILICNPNYDGAKVNV